MNTTTQVFIIMAYFAFKVFAVRVLILHFGISTIYIHNLEAFKLCSCYVGYKTASELNKQHFNIFLITEVLSQHFKCQFITFISK